MKKTQSTRATPGSLWSPIHALTVLAEAGSFTAAAQRLNLSKAAMSQRVAELEAAAGVPLVQRTTRSMQLTDAGRQLVAATQGAFASIDQAFAQVRDLAAAPSGRLRVTAPVALARQCIVPLLPGFLAAYPALQIELDLSDRIRPLAQEGFDLAIRHTSTPPDTHVAWMLRQTRSVLLASPAYLARRPAPKAPLDLREHDCLYYPRAGDTPAWSFEPTGSGPGERVSVPIQGPFAANNSEALREAALAGLGITLLPDFSAEPALVAGELVELLPGWRPVGAFGTHLWAIRPYAAQVPRGVRALVDWLAERLRPDASRVPVP
ncbi:LysR family transcriptional regulator [Ideonella sp.]|uniref:LysR family transcriptional regulator n=1 Tax=Ideonella sp. TaxID=1929293 RepID=UPI002B47B6E9|nr:LysR family transcriptional regulator [Ideonella sp.]HJV69431.1 LysR family transcriptional regulator [Ideonella sp.]